MCASECMAGEKVVTEKEQKKTVPLGRERSLLKMETFVLLMGLKETWDIRDIQQKSYKTSPVLAFQTIKGGHHHHHHHHHYSKDENKCRREQMMNLHQVIFEQKSSQTFSDSRFCCFSSLYETLNWTVVMFWRVCWTLWPLTIKFFTEKKICSLIINKKIIISCSIMA